MSSVRSERAHRRGLGALTAMDFAKGAGVVLLVATSACGASAPAATSSEGAPPSTGALPPHEGAPGEASTPEAPSVAPSGARDESIAPGTECDGAGECTGSYYAEVPQTEADCQCPTCASYVVNLARLGEISQAVRRVCGEWQRTHDCPPVTCVERTTQARCVRGACVDAPIVRDESPSPCRSPADCPRGAACVTAALGGERGCTDETCCGAAECSNGCVTDADCPSCRSECRDGACRNPHGAM